MKKIKAMKIGHLIVNVTVFQRNHVYDMKCEQVKNTYYQQRL